MISDQKTAKDISDLMLEIFRRMDESVAFIRETCPPEEAAAYQKAVGRVAGPIVIDVLEPLYARHPEFKPPKWDD